MSGSADPPSLEPYHPIDVLKPVDRDLWIVDGPVVRMRYIVGHLPFSSKRVVNPTLNG